MKKTSIYAQALQLLNDGMTTNPVHRVLDLAGLPSYLLNEVDEIKVMTSPYDLRQSMYDGEPRSDEGCGLMLFVVGGTYLVQVDSAEERSNGIIKRRHWVGMVVVTPSADINYVAKLLETALSRFPTTSMDVSCNFGPQWSNWGHD